MNVLDRPHVAQPALETDKPPKSRVLSIFFLVMSLILVALAFLTIALKK